MASASSASSFIDSSSSAAAMSPEAAAAEAADEVSLAGIPLWLTDRQLAAIPVRDLNRLMEQQRLTEEQIGRVKRYRRMLKNREYALSSNRRKDELCVELERQRDDLRQLAATQAAGLRAQRGRIDEWQAKIAGLEALLTGQAELQEAPPGFAMLTAEQASVDNNTSTVPKSESH